MTGSGHSFSDVAMGKGTLLVPGQLRRFLELDRSQLHPGPAGDGTLVRVESGARIREMNAWLWERGLSLGVLGGWDEQTIVGAASTGTHGSSLYYGPIADAIVSYQVVGTGGEVLQIEPAHGITDPAKFCQCIRTPGGSSVPMKLVQNDDMFRAMQVNLGCLGIVYAVVVKAEPRFWLREHRSLTTWGALTGPGGFLSRLAANQRTENAGCLEPAYYEIYVSPYPPKGSSEKADHQCILTKRYKLTTEPANLTMDERKRGVLGANAEKFLTVLSGRGNAIRTWIDLFPKSIRNLVTSELRTFPDENYTSRSYKVFNLGPANEVRAFGIELAFDFNQTVAVAERLFDLAAEFAKDGLYNATAPSLRFVRSTTAFLAMQEGRTSTMLEMGQLVGQHGAEDLLKRYEGRFMDEMGARPHWGLDLNMMHSFAEVRRVYPKAESWHKVYRQLNARGTFNGRLTDRLGISMRPT